MKPISILIRTSYRPEQFKRAYDSIPHDLCSVIVCYDDERALEYIPEHVEKFHVERSDKEYGYNEYCDKLRQRVTDPYFMFLDDDDTIIPGSLKKVIPLLKIDGGIVPFLRNGVQKPSKSKIKAKLILKGHIGLPCIILNSRYKGFGSFTCNEDADYQYIKECTGSLNLQWIDIPIVSCGNRSHGKMEK